MDFIEICLYASEGSVGADYRESLFMFQDTYKKCSNVIKNSEFRTYGLGSKHNMEYGHINVCKRSLDELNNRNNGKLLNPSGDFLFCKLGDNLDREVFHQIQEDHEYIIEKIRQLKNRVEVRYEIYEFHKDLLDGIVEQLNGIKLEDFDNSKYISLFVNDTHHFVVDKRTDGEKWENWREEMGG